MKTPVFVFINNSIYIRARGSYFIAGDAQGRALIGDRALISESAYCLFE